MMTIQALILSWRVVKCKGADGGPLRFPFCRIVVLSILCLAGFVNVGRAEDANRPVADAKELRAFFQKLIKTGKDYSYDAGRAKLLGIEKGAPTKFEEISRDSVDASDEWNHGCELVLDPSRKTPSPVCFVVRVGTVVGEGSTDYYFKLTPDGVVEKAFIGHGKYQNGKVVRGSGRVEFTTLGAPGMRERLQHELDIWLKGMYRKTPVKTADAADAADMVKDALAAIPK